MAPHFENTSHHPKSVSNIGYQFLGRVSFEDARAYQEAAISQVDSVGETIIYCEHPATLSVGKRGDTTEATRVATRHDLHLVKTDRGGHTTYHGPGQLVIYPVINLRARGIGVRQFVETGLSAMQAVLWAAGVPVRVDLERVGLWTIDRNRKIASCGLRIIHGVTSHGFSVNLAGSLDIYRRFSPCGESAIVVTSLERETNTEQYSLELFAAKVQSEFERFLG